MQDEANHQRAMEMETLKAKLAELQREHDRDMQDRQQAHEYGMVKLLSDYKLTHILIGNHRL